MDKLKLDRKSLRKFGLTMSIAFAVIALIIFFKHGYHNTLVWIISGLFLLTGMLLPELLKPVYIIWMKFAFILGWVNTRIILCILFYLFFTPISIGIKIFRLDLLDLRIDKSAKSYWRKKEKPTFDPNGYERQF